MAFLIGGIYMYYNYDFIETMVASSKRKIQFDTHKISFIIKESNYGRAVICMDNGIDILTTADYKELIWHLIENVENEDHKIRTIAIGLES